MSLFGAYFMEFIPFIIIIFQKLAHFIQFYLLKQYFLSNKRTTCIDGHLILSTIAIKLSEGFIFAIF